MVTHKTVAFAGALALSAGAAQAQEIGFGGSLSFSTDYVASGESQTGRQPAAQLTAYGYVPSGFYAGVFLSNVDFSEMVGDYYAVQFPGFTWDDPDSIEIGLFVGWEYETAAGLSLDVGYERYFYDVSGNCCGLIFASVGYSISDMVEVGAFASFNHTSETTNLRAEATIYPTDNIGLRAMAGWTDGNFNENAGSGYPSSITYWNVGVDYYLTDSFSVSLDYHDSTSPVRTSNLVAGLTFTF